MKKINEILTPVLISVSLSALIFPTLSQAIQGPCSECHTMHNSQDNDPMTYNSSGTPNELLLRGSCYGCHAQGGSTPVVSLTTDDIPQVLHTGATDLAGGNFAYITGDKGAGNENRGHNISDLTGIDTTLSTPPGVYASTHTLVITSTNLTCAGSIGCHGYRQPIGDPRAGIAGSHHNNLNGQLTVADEPGNSYRFLTGVKGLESSDWEQNPSSTDHNEYYGRTTPIEITGCTSSFNGCHGAAVGVKPVDGTMSQFCATCHGNFHMIGDGTTSGYEGIGTDATSPFIRHPTDLALPSTGEYAAYQVYNPEAPVARTTGVPAISGSTVTPGTDAVMCLSCHRAHASNYPDMLRWDYTTMVAGGGTSTSGCFTCHSTKDDGV